MRCIDPRYPLKSMLTGLFFAAVFFTASGLFALDFHVGGGGILGFSASETESGNTMLQDVSIFVDGTNINFHYKESMKLWYKSSSFDIGFFVFADCTYAEFSVGYLGQIGKIRGQGSSHYFYEDINGVKTPCLRYDGK